MKKIRLSIGKKLLIGFFIVVVMLIVVSGVSIRQMNQMGDKAKVIKDKSMPSVQTLGAIQADLINGQRLAVMVILEPDDKIREQLEARLAAVVNDLKEKQAEYERTLLSSEEERKLYEDLIKNENEYFALLPTTYAQKSKLLNLGRANGAHELAKEMEASLDQALDILAKAVESNANEAGKATDASFSIYESARQLAVIMSALAVIIAIVLALLISRVIAKPMIVMAKTAERIASGDLTSEEIKVRSRDEVGDLAGSFNEMSMNLRDLIRQVGSGAEQVAASAEQLTASAEQVSKATEQIALTVQDVAEGSEKQVRSVDESAKAIHEMSSAVQHIAANAHNVTSTSNHASEIAMEGNEGIRKAVDQMNSINLTVNGLAQAVQGLGERSQEIGQIVKVITEIASQTNLLALNAAIEAARAGVHGRGFAVVADEVRQLSEQSAQAARQIVQLIGTIQGETSLAVQSMEAGRKEVAAGIYVVNKTGESFEQIQRSVDEVANQIREVSSAAQQVSARMEQMVNSINIISDVADNASTGTQEVSAAAQEQIASMEEISASAAGLSKLSGDLNVLIGKFKV